jgi:MFS family permease
VTVTVLMVAVFFHMPVMELLGASSAVALYSFWVMLFLFGIFWGSIITNSFPMLWQMATFANMGIYTGLYYFFSQTAAIAAPPITGWLIDLGGYRSIFLYAAVCLAIAFVFMGLVTGGEPDHATGTADDVPASDGGAAE